MNVKKVVRKGKRKSETTKVNEVKSNKENKSVRNVKK